jgi:hypothetical protein
LSIPQSAVKNNPRKSAIAAFCAKRRRGIEMAWRLDIPGHGTQTLDPFESRNPRILNMTGYRSENFQDMMDNACNGVNKNQSPPFARPTGLTPAISMIKFWQSQMLQGEFAVLVATDTGLRFS